MKKILMPLVALAMFTLPATANAAQCRDSGTGKFAKCGAPGAVPASQYVAKGKPKAKAAKPAAAPAPAAAATKPAPAAAKTARCKTAKGKFVKCGSAGALPA